MTKYEQELQQLKPYDEVQFTSEDNGYDKITTSGHGYLIVPTTDIYYDKARKICKYGFMGNLACYLEEDVEIGEFFSVHPR